MNIENRKLIIDTLVKAFKKITRDKLPQHITGNDCADILPTLFNKDLFLVSKSTLNNRLKKFEDDNKRELFCALWWSITSNANPYKMEVSTMFFWDRSQQDLFKSIDKILTPISQFLAHLDKDRAKLSSMGVW
jgi:hypothetical protein|tara:strand:- start:244 stop:642 length:399 start_codon:yes stop_codon:yes gene_type:complete